MSAKTTARTSTWLPGGFLSRVAVLAGGTAMGQVALVLSSPILTRLYAPADWGQFGLFQTFVGFAGIVATLRYEAAILSAPTPADAARLSLGAGAVAAVLSGVSGAVCAALVLNGWFGYEALPLWTAPLAGAAVFLTAAYAVLRYWAIHRDMSGLASTVYVVQNVGRAVAQSALGVVSGAVPGLILGDVAGRALGVAHLARRTWAASRADAAVTWRSVATCLREYRTFPMYGLPSSLLDGAAQLLPLPLLVSAFGAEVGGLFLLVQRILAVPSALVGASVGDVFQAQFSARWSDDTRAATAFFWRVAAGLFAVGVLPALVVVVAGPVLFEVVFGPAWRPAGEMAAVLAPLSLAALVVSPLSRLVFALRGQPYKLLYDLTAFAGVVAVFAAQHVGALAVRPTLVLLSASQVAGYGVYLAALWRLLRVRGRQARTPDPR